MADETKSAVPSRVDPFEAAIERVRRKESKIYFGALRGEGTDRSRHNGVDLFVPVGTPIQIPAPKVVLIGMVREARSGAGASMGNGIVLFVPDEKQPYFLQLAHLSPRTFGLLRRSGFRIGSMMVDRPGGTVVAVAGSSMAGAMPHVHASVMTSFRYGGKTYTAAAFLEMYRDGSIPRENFFAAKPPSRYGNSMSLKGYLDPMELIGDGRLRFANRPAPPLVAQRKEREKPVLLALR